MNRYLASIFTVLTSIALSLLFTTEAAAQLERQRAATDRPVDVIFPASQHIGIGTVYNLPARNLNTTVSHTFGLVDGGINRLFGLDDGANTRIGVEYGITDGISAGIGRMNFLNVVDLRGKATLLRQTESGSMPVEVAASFSAGVTTQPGTGAGFSDRLSYLASVMVARRFNGLSLQVSPMFAHFNTVPAAQQQQLFGLGLAALVNLTDRLDFTAEFVPVLGERNPNTSHSVGAGLNIDTGGHVFQLFLTTSQWHNEQYILARNTDRFFEGDIRFGFTIHRAFGL